MPYCNQRCIEEEAKQFYISKMDDYYKDCYNTMIFDGKSRPERPLAGCRSPGLSDLNREPPL